MTMWDKKFSVITETNCTGYHPALGKGDFLQSGENYLLQIGNKIYDSFPAVMLTASVNGKSYSLEQIDENTFISGGDEVILSTGIGGWLRTDGIMNEPYNSVINGVFYGVRYWRGDITIDITNPEPQSFTLNEENGNTTATIRVNISRWGWWEGSNSTPRGKFVGKGSYEGEARFIGTPIWTSNVSNMTFKGIIKDGKLALDLPYNKETNVYYIGEYENEDKGWNEISADDIEVGKDFVLLGRGKQQQEPIIGTFKEYTNDAKINTHFWISELPNWRSVGMR